MSETKKSDGKATESGGGSPLILVLVLIGVAVMFLATVRRREPAPSPQYINLPLPSMTVEGWVNAAGPVRDDMLRGQVVLVDCWFVDCPPCRCELRGRPHRSPRAGIPARPRSASRKP